MRPSHLIVFLLIPTLSYASGPCTSADLLAGTPSSPPCTSLTIDTPVVYPANTTAPAIDFTVNGDVYINANVILDGADGVHITLDDNFYDYISGGPGASEGGGFVATSSLNASEASNTFHDIYDGVTAPTAAGVCNPGGSGGGLLTAGVDGSTCPSDPTIAIGGQNLTPISLPIRGGYGGGAGGPFEVIPSTLYDLGSGGGGGGGLRISATGRIYIKQGVLISARGGRGGDATNLGGAGGGGSGGIIWLESPFPIVNKGIIDVSGGAGGVHTNATGPKGGDGGKGGDGVFRAIEAGTTSDSSGRSDYSVSSRKLKSDISCGIVSEKEKNTNFFMQLTMGFLLIGLFKILFRFPKKVL